MGQCQCIEQSTRLYYSQTTCLLASRFPTFLQIEELIGEVGVNYKKQKFLEQTLHLLKNTLDNLQSAKSEKEVCGR